MAFTQYTESTDIILNLGKDPEDRPDLDDDGLAHKFDQNSENIVTWLNETHLPEAQEQIDTKTNSLLQFVDDTASRNIAATDFEKKLRANHATVPIVYTVPKDATLNLPVGFYTIIEMTGAAQVSVAADTDVTIKLATKLKVNGQGTSAVLMKEKANEWSFQGSVKA